MGPVALVRRRRRGRRRPRAREHVPQLRHGVVGQPVEPRRAAAPRRTRPARRRTARTAPRARARRRCRQHELPAGIRARRELRQHAALADPGLADHLERAGPPAAEPSRARSSPRRRRRARPAARRSRPSSRPRGEDNRALVQGARPGCAPDVGRGLRLEGLVAVPRFLIEHRHAPHECGACSPRSGAREPAPPLPMRSRPACATGAAPHLVGGGGGRRARSARARPVLSSPSARPRPASTRSGSRDRLESHSRRSRR